jgi:hypothetical protein
MGACFLGWVPHHPHTAGGAATRLDSQTPCRCSQRDAGRTPAAGASSGVAGAARSSVAGGWYSSTLSAKPRNASRSASTARNGCLQAQLRHQHTLLCRERRSKARTAKCKHLVLRHRMLPMHAKQEVVGPTETGSDALVRSPGLGAQAVRGR